MTDIDIATRKGLPVEMQLLLKDYPREAWPDHPDFARSIRNWLGAHAMFRRLTDLTRDATETYLNRAAGAEEFAPRLAHYGNRLTGNLHGHHTWEDRSYFPELSRADPRFDRGLEMLETDHAALDRVLDRFTRTGNRVLKLIDLDEPQARGEAALLRDTTDEIGTFLARHLADEEDLVVPILLHHRMRG